MTSRPNSPVRSWRPGPASSSRARTARPGGEPARLSVRHSRRVRRRRARPPSRAGARSRSALPGRPSAGSPVPGSPDPWQSQHVIPISPLRRPSGRKRLAQSRARPVDAEICPTRPRGSAGVGDEPEERRVREHAALRVHVPRDANVRLAVPVEVDGLGHEVEVDVPVPGDADVASSSSGRSCSRPPPCSAWARKGRCPRWPCRRRSRRGRVVQFHGFTTDSTGLATGALARPASCAGILTAPAGLRATADAQREHA